MSEPKNPFVNGFIESELERAACDPISGRIDAILAATLLVLLERTKHLAPPEEQE